MSTAQQFHPRYVLILTPRGVQFAIASVLALSILGHGCREAPLRIAEPHLAPVASVAATPLPARFFAGESAGWSLHLRGISVGKVNMIATADRFSDLNVNVRFKPNRFARQFSNKRASAHSRFDPAGWLLEATETVGAGMPHTRRVSGDGQTIHSPLSLLGMLRSATAFQPIETVALEVAGERYRVESVAPTNDFLDERNVLRIDLVITELLSTKRKRSQATKRAQTLAATVWISRDHRSTLLRLDLETKRSRVIAKSIFHDVPAVAMP